MKSALKVVSLANTVSPNFSGYPAERNTSDQTLEACVSFKPSVIRERIEHADKANHPHPTKSINTQNSQQT
jgi:hypothetical protein